MAGDAIKLISDIIKTKSMPFPLREAFMNGFRSVRGQMAPLESLKGRQSFCGAASLWLRKTFGLWTSQRPFHHTHETSYWSHYAIKPVVGNFTQTAGCGRRRIAPMSETEPCSLGTSLSIVIVRIIIIQF